MKAVLRMASIVIMTISILVWIIIPDFIPGPIDNILTILVTARPSIQGITEKAA